MDFKDKIAVVTGGAQGIGRCIAEEFRKAKATVCVIDKQPGDHFVGDIADKNVLELFVKEVIARHGRVDYLVNNALPLMKGISDCSYEEFQYAMNVGVTAPFYLAKLFAPHFGKEVAIVNISSSRDRMSQPQTESYTAAKGGIAALTQHPEGGYYRQVFGNDATGNKAISSIYYLLTANDISAFHRLHDMVEIWYFHAGEPLNIYVIDPDGSLTVHKLSNGNEMQVVIESEQWFAAEIPSKQGFCLVGCAVGPAFSFEKFELACKDDLLKLYPQHSELIVRMCILETSCRHRGFVHRQVRHHRLGRFAPHWQVPLFQRLHQASPR
ncbi:MAG: SDR family NAD(P)-dependent oxidoreductase [Bacteroidales bacterium]|nr:SDR family NAD(P)-dependent oxidoreductase [Bacteroidales bacterium]